MHWEVPFVLAFILLFSIWISVPSAEGQYYTIDTNGFKHYILTPEVYDNNNPLDDITNLLFLRYEDPWNSSEGERITDSFKIKSEQSSTNDNPIVPQLLEQEFEVEADIVIINVQSYPTVGGNWTVYLTTKGKADLIITGINGTTFGEAEPDDLQLLHLKCGDQIISYQWNGNSIIVPDYTCDKIGEETSKVLTTGKHYLEFRFENDVGYAQNLAAEFNVQRGYTIISASSNTATITAGTEYTAPTG
ncbi:MAG: hypothetical protein IH795_10040, partial [Bacteroidetes bacterium]|nr:hypothetical protein [Bacteroidota bacterium]